MALIDSNADIAKKIAYRVAAIVGFGLYIYFFIYKP